MSHTLGYLLAAGTLKAVKIDHHHVTQIANPAVPQDFRALADEPLRIHIFHAQLFAFARQHQRAYLQKSKVRGLTQTLRQTHRKLDFDRPSERVFSDFCELFENSGQRKHSMLENRRQNSRFVFPAG